MIFRLPTWAIVALGLTFPYQLVNALFCVRLSGGGNAALAEGQYALMSHGRLLAHLTEPAYHAHRAVELRLFQERGYSFS